MLLMPARGIRGIRLPPFDFCFGVNRTLTLDNFDFTFNPKINRSLVFDLATGAFIAKREDALFLGPGGTGESHLAQAIGQAPSNRATACGTARRMCCSMSWPTPSSRALEKNTCNPWLRCPC